MLQLTFNPGLTLPVTDFRTTRPNSLFLHQKIPINNRKKIYKLAAYNEVHEYSFYNLQEQSNCLVWLGCPEMFKKSSYSIPCQIYFYNSVISRNRKTEIGHSSKIDNSFFWSLCLQTTTVWIKLNNNIVIVQNSFFARNWPKLSWPQK